LVAGCGVKITQKKQNRMKAALETVITPSAAANEQKSAVGMDGNPKLTSSRRQR